MAEGIGKMLGFEAFSRGILGADGLPADERAVAICKEHDIDISHHKASTVTEKDLEEAHLVLCMENKHIEYLKQWFPLFAHKVYLLGGFAGIGEIDDPIGCNIDKYRETFEKIMRSIDALKKILEKN